MKKLLFSLIIFLFPIMLTYANSINNINIDIYVDENGNANITETWDANFYEDTEGYHPYFNIGNATISDLEVSMDGEKFTTIVNWDTYSSYDETVKLEKKAYKAGIYYNGNEIDLCFGITSYGHHIYTLKYKINGFILRTKDADMINWTLFPHFDPSPDNVDIKIYSDISYSDNLELYSYGYDNKAYIYNGYIYMSSNGKFKSNDKMAILVKFPINTFNTTNITTNDFNYYKESVMGSDIFSIIKNIIIFISLVVGFLYITSCITVKERYTYGTKGNIINKKVPFFRDIPCNNDIFRAYFIAYKYNLLRQKEDFIGAILLKWLKDGNVKTETIEKKILFKSKETNSIIFINKNNLTKLEEKLYDWMLEASNDSKLESKEFEIWCKNNSKKISTWFDDVIEYERDILIEEGNITEETKKKIKLFKYINYDLSDSLMEEAVQLKGLKLYLKEFTIIKERQTIEVKLWNEYLIFAQIFGIAEKVAKQFEKLYPEITNEIDKYSYDYDTLIKTIDFINLLSMTSSSAIKKGNSSSDRDYGGPFGDGSGGGGTR